MIVVFFVLTIFLLMCSAFFSASEAALFSIPRERISLFGGSPHGHDRAIHALLQNSQRTLMVILLGNLTVNISVVNTINYILVHTFPKQGPLFTFAIATLLILFFGEILPKSIGVTKNYLVARFSAPILLKLSRFLAGVIILFFKINRHLLHFFQEHLRKPSPFITEDEFSHALETYRLNGVISSEEGALLETILAQSQVQVATCIIHRTELIYQPPAATPRDAYHAMRAKKAWFCCVESNDAEKIEGFYFMEDFALPRRHSEGMELFEPVKIVPSSWCIADTTHMMVQNNFRAVAIAGERGEFMGVFTLQSGVRRLLQTTSNEMGEGGDDHGAPLMSATFDGGESLWRIGEWIPPSLEKNVLKFKTLNGLLVDYLGKIQVTGEIFAIDGWMFYIIHSDSKTVKSVKIEKGRNNVG